MAYVSGQLFVYPNNESVFGETSLKMGTFHKYSRLLESQDFLKIINVDKTML